MCQFKYMPSVFVSYGSLCPVSCDSRSITVVFVSVGSRSAAVLCMCHLLVKYICVM